MAYLLGQMHYPEYPEVLGVLRDAERPIYERAVLGQVEQARQAKGQGDLAELYHAADTWTVSG